MAKKDKKEQDSSSSVSSQRFDNDLIKDINDYHLEDNQWVHARNAINNSKKGDLGRLGNEPANLKCAEAPYTIIGTIHIESDKWVIFSTDDTDSEIGYFQEDICSYSTIVNDRCLNFNRKYLIKGVSRETSECNHIAYWDDGNNPSRFLNIGDIKDSDRTKHVPYICEDELVGNNVCYECVPIQPLQLNCDKIRLAPLMEPLCFRVEQGASGGELLNGSYFVVAAYTIKGERMTDYFPPSNQQPLFSHIGVGGSLDIHVTRSDTDYFDEFELVIVSVIAQQTSARKLGIYSTKQKLITLDIIDISLPSVPIEILPIRSQVYDKSDAMYSVNDYLLRVGPTTKLEFNYQPFANQIVTKWQSVEYDADYYKNGGNKPGYMRDEVYSFFIRWVYDTGDRTASYHIPGRPVLKTSVNSLFGAPPTPPFFEFSNAPISADNIEVLQNGIDCPAKVWEVYNTATTTTTGISIPVDDYDTCLLEGRGSLIQEGLMGYWESTELYPDNKPEIWNANLSTPPPGYVDTEVINYNLCGLPIRHHKFPDNDHSYRATIFDTTAAGDPTPRRQKIRIMGVKFENIKFPTIDPHDPTSPKIPGIIGFEILRGSRKGNRTIVAKGIINNMVKYDIPDDVSNKDGLFQNYPYNDIRGDEFLSSRKTRWAGSGDITTPACSVAYLNKDGDWILNSSQPDYQFDRSNYSFRHFSFHSPETTFANPFLGAKELKIYQELDGKAEMYYQYPDGHPKHKMMKDLAWLLAAIAGLGAGLNASIGKVTRNYLTPSGSVLGPTPNPLWFEATGLSALLGQLGFGYDLAGQVPLLNALTTGTPTGNQIEEGNQTAVSPAIGALMNFLGGVPTFAYYWAEGAEATWRLIRNAVSYRQYALQQFSHCFYNNSVSSSSGASGAGLNRRPFGNRRRYINDLSYVDNQIQDFDNKRINNLFRSKYVALKTNLALDPPVVEDRSRLNTSLKGVADSKSNNIEKSNVYKDPEQKFERTSSTYYAAIKQRLKNQYGQIDSISQIPITTCPYIFDECETYVELEQLVINGTFQSNFNNWLVTPSGYWTPSNQRAKTQGGSSVVSNRLYQNLNIIPGELYTFSFDVIQLDNRNKVNVGFNTNNASGPLDFNTVGTYSKNFVGQTGDNAVVIQEDVLSVNNDCLVDLVFVIDRSGSVNVNPPGPNSEWSLQKNFIKAIVNNLAVEINNDKVHVGLVYFGSSAGFQPAVPNSVPSIIAAIDLIPDPVLEQFTNIASGLCQATTLLFGTAGRPNAEKKIMFITDGAQNIDNSCLYGNVTAGSFVLEGCNPPAPPLNPSLPVHAQGISECAALAANLRNVLGIKIIGIQTGTDEEICVYAQYTLAITNKPALTFAANFQSLPNILLAVKDTVCALTPTIIDNVKVSRIGCDDDDTASIGPLFNGDTYINRYTEKNTFFYFYNWLFRQDDGEIFDYSKYAMLPYPTYWVNTEEFDVMEGAVSLTAILGATGFITATIADTGNMLGDVGTWIGDVIAGNEPSPIDVTPTQTLALFNNLKTPSDYHVLDRPDFVFSQGNVSAPLLPDPLSRCGPGLIIKYGYFYLFNSGVRDFYVESEYNTALRDWGDESKERHYDYKNYTNLPDMFSTENIRFTNYYKYDTSLSISKNWFSYVNWGNTQLRSYDPTLAETCYQYRPDRIIYSLQAQYESIKDNWRIFLINNYKDFLSRVTAVKQINKSGAIILFESDSPVMFQGLDQLETDAGVKLTIGDGGLFSQPMQNIVNADRPYEFGSCQNRLSVINTPAGTYWINQNQGKIFGLTNGLKEISAVDVRWWLTNYLPYQLTKYIPNYTFTDNPIVGIGCQTIYDNENALIYFSKKDYKPKLDDQGNSLVTYNDTTEEFEIAVGDINIPVVLGDPNYFENASWTFSYDPKIENWVSHHDWHPDLTMPGKNTFMSTKDNGIWIHNERCDLYCNYYGIDYPFEIEYTINTVQQVNTLRSIEYQLEVYRYKNDNCYDRFHTLDFNFDEAIIYNTEQCSGLLKLNLSPKNDAPAILTYPQVTPVGVGSSGSIDILYSKEENKYRFNQFWDTTYDRGEFFNPGIPGFAERAIWNTQANGYIKDLNLNNLNYSKSQLERKKFRHYTTSILLRRKVSGNSKMLLSFVNNKNLYSPR